MKKLLTICLFIATLLVAAVNVNAKPKPIVHRGSDTSLMEGQINDDPIKMMLWTDAINGKATGWYYYTSQGPSKKIQLSGSMKGDDMKCKLNLKEIVDGKEAGSFRGDFWRDNNGNSGFNGTWTPAKSKDKLNFEVNSSSPGPNN